MFIFIHLHLYMMYLNILLYKITWIFYWYTSSSTFRTCHLYSHSTLTIINWTSTTTISTSTRCCTRFTFRTITCSTYTNFIKCYSLLCTIYWVKKWYIQLYINICTFHLSFTFTTHIKEWSKITKYWFIKFKFLGSTTSCTTLSKKTTICSKWILSSCLILFISCHTNLIIYFSFILIW